MGLKNEVIVLPKLGKLILTIEHLTSNHTKLVSGFLREDQCEQEAPTNYLP